VSKWHLKKHILKVLPITPVWYQSLSSKFVKWIAVDPKGSWLTNLEINFQLLKSPGFTNTKCSALILREKCNIEKSDSGFDSNSPIWSPAFSNMGMYRSFFAKFSSSMVKEKEYIWNPEIMRKNCLILAVMFEPWLPRVAKNLTNSSSL